MLKLWRDYVNPNYALGIKSPKNPQLRNLKRAKKNPQLRNLKRANLYIYIANLFVFDICKLFFMFTICDDNISYKVLVQLNEKSIGNLHKL